MGLLGVFVLALPLVPVLPFCSLRNILLVATAYVGFLSVLAARHLGWRSKIFLLLGIRSKALANSRVLFVPAQEGKRSKVLIVSFAGGALQYGGFTQMEFRNTLSSLNCDALYLMDPGQSFYLMNPDDTWTGFDHHEQLLRQHTSQYEGSLFIGASMGASAALLFGHLATRAVVFSPFVDLDKEVRWDYWLSKFRLPRHLRAMMAKRILSNVSSRPELQTHVGRSYGDIDQALLLPAKSVVIHEGCNSHGVAKFLRNRGELLPLLQQSVAAIASP